MSFVCNLCVLLIFPLLFFSLLLFYKFNLDWKYVMDVMYNPDIYLNANLLICHVYFQVTQEPHTLKLKSKAKEHAWTFGEQKRGSGKHSFSFLTFSCTYCCSKKIHQMILTDKFNSILGFGSDTQ